MSREYKSSPERGDSAKVMRTGPEGPLSAHRRKIPLGSCTFLAPAWPIQPCAQKRCLQREGHLPAPANELPRGQRRGRAEKKGTQASPGRGKGMKPSKVVYTVFAITKCLVVIQTKNDCIRLFFITSLQPRKFFCHFPSFVHKI